jgi:hypothetical protein
MPRSVVLRGRRWEVRYMTPRAQKGKLRGLDGHCDLDAFAIDIRPGLSRLQQERTLIHELLHAMWPADIVSDAVEERLIRRLETPLRSLLVSGVIIAAPEEVR